MKKKAVLLALLSGLVLFLVAGTITLASTSEMTTESTGYQSNSRQQQVSQRDNYRENRMYRDNSYRGHCHDNNGFMRQNHSMNFWK